MPCEHGTSQRAWETARRCELKERPLILFTLLVQLSVGAFLTLGGLYFLFLYHAGASAANALTNSGLLAIGPLVGLGMLASLFHLGTPRNAYKALFNWRSSWLSREILFTLLFTFSGAVFSALQWYQIGPFYARALVAGLTGLSGLALVYSMARLYMLRTLPAWNASSTLLSFFTTTFLLGSLAAGVFMAFQTFPEAGSQLPASLHRTLARMALSELALIWFLLLGVLLIGRPMSLPGWFKDQESDAARWRNRILLLRLALIFGGAGVMGWLVYQQAAPSGSGNDLAALTLAAFGLVLVGEILGRYLFYEIRPQPMSG